MPRYLITGANRGIGLEFTKQLLGRGDSVVACCRNPENANELKELALQYTEDTLMICQLDVVDVDTIKSLPKALAAKGLIMDVLILNAAVAEPTETLDSIDETAMMRTLHVNAVAPMLLIQAFSTHFQMQNSGSKIICISSDLGSITYASGLTFGLSYGMSKAALNMGVKKLCPVLSKTNTAIIALHPGWVKTDMGGSNAIFSPTTSVLYMLNVIDTLTIEQTGNFLDFEGQNIPW